MPRTRTAGRLRPTTTTTRRTATLCVRSSHIPDVEHVSLDELFDAYYSCRKNKRNTDSALRYELNFIANNERLYEELNRQTYEIGRSTAFCVRFPKVREVFAADFRDRIVHHLVVNRLGECFEQEMLDCAYACRKGKGVLYGVRDVQRQMAAAGGDAWYAKCDIEGFFMSIDRQVLFGEVERILGKYGIGDAAWWLWLLRKIIFNRPEWNCEVRGDRTLWDVLPPNKSLFHSGGRGLPIGNLTSQVFANVYLSVFDRWMAGHLPDGGYGRYVDDFIIIHRDKQKVVEMVERARTYLKDELGLTLHPRKLTIQQVRRGVRFAGIMIKGRCQYPSRRLVKGAFDAADGITRKGSIVESINSRFGLMRHTCSYNLRRRIWRKLSATYKGKYICYNFKKIKERKL